MIEDDGPQRWVRGVLSFQEKKLIVEVNSRERWAALRQLLLSLGHDPEVSFEHSVDPKLELPWGTNIAPQKERGKISGSKGFREAWARHWPDEPVPALGGKTPREAAKDPEGRIRLEALLREFEYSASVNRSRGVDDFDVSRLREELEVL